MILGSRTTCDAVSLYNATLTYSDRVIEIVRRFNVWLQLFLLVPNVHPLVLHNRLNTTLQVL